MEFAPQINCKRPLRKSVIWRHGCHDISMDRQVRGYRHKIRYDNVVIDLSIPEYIILETAWCVCTVKRLKSVRSPVIIRWNYRVRVSAITMSIEMKHAGFCCVLVYRALITRFMGPTWGTSRGDRTHVGPILTPWTLLSGGYVSSLQ